MRVFDEKPLPIRRSRGYVPEYVRIGFSIGDAWLAAFGAELRNTICILHGDRCLISQHIGDVENLETLDFLREALTHLLNLFRADVSIDFVACDLHPRYLSTRYAKELSEKIGARLIPVQHHHAHAVSLMVDNGLDPSDSAVVIAADGVGYGVDGSIWGGEVLEVSFRRFVRRGCLKPHSMPGGDRATLYPLRMLISYLMSAWEERDVIRVISHHIEKGLPKGWDEYEAVKKRLEGVDGVVGVVPYVGGAAVVQTEFNLQSASFASPAQNLRVCGSGRLNPGCECPGRPKDAFVSVHTYIVVGAVEFQSTAVHAVTDELRTADRCAVALVAGEIPAVAVEGPVTLQTCNDVASADSTGEDENGHRRQT